MPIPSVATTWEQVEDIQQSFNTFWLAEPIVTFLSWDNTPAEITDSGVSLAVTSSDPDVSGEAFTVMQILHAGGSNAALGTKRFKQIGVITAAVYAEANKGRKRSAGKIADQALRWMQTQDVAGLSLENQRLNEIGLDGNWYRINVVTDFVYEIHRS